MARDYTKYKKLMRLGDDRMTEVDFMFYNNVKATKIAARIQDEWGMLTDIKRDTLQRLLGKYKREVVDKRLVGDQSKPKVQ